MALYHVDMAIITKGQGGMSTGFATYIARQDVQHGANHARYLLRDGREGTDLEAAGHGGMPSWVKDGREFWEVADANERHQGRIARTVQVTLPRELSSVARRDLVEDILETYFARFPHAWAMHRPVGRDGRVSATFACYLVGTAG